MDVWGIEPGGDARRVDTHVKRLRDKLGSAGKYGFPTDGRCEAS